MTLLDRTDGVLQGWYARVGPWSGSLVIALVLVFLVHGYVQGGSEPISHGTYYAALSTGPFDTEAANPFRARILAPLIGWLTGLRGSWFVLVPWVFLVGFLAQVNVWCSTRGATPSHALAVVLAIAFSPVTMHALVGPGFVDTVSYFLLAAALMNLGRTVVSCGFMALAVMTHEASAVLIPAWLLASGVGKDHRRAWLKRMLIVAVMLLPYALYRSWVLRVDPGSLSTAYYFSERNVQSCLDVGLWATLVGIFAVFRMHWLLIAIAIIRGGWKSLHSRWSFVVLLCIGSTLVIAFDTTRMFCWAFPVMILAGVDLARSVGRRAALLLLVAAWSLNFLFAPYTTTGGVSYRLNGIRAFVQD
ncbi:MAG: hypothetical protein ACO1NQ_05430 [Flavobacteriales bacterium]